MRGAAALLSIACAACGKGDKDKGKGKGGGGESDDPGAAKISEGQLNLNRLAKAVKTYVVQNGQLPPESAGPTPPAGSCCAGPDHKCPVDGAQWTAAWQTLDFRMDEAHMFSYQYEVKDPQKEAVLHAIGDLDCDGTTFEYTARITIVGGNPQVELGQSGAVD